MQLVEFSWQIGIFGDIKYYDFYYHSTARNDPRRTGG